MSVMHQASRLRPKAGRQQRRQAKGAMSQMSMRQSPTNQETMSRIKAAETVLYMKAAKTTSCKCGRNKAAAATKQRQRQNSSCPIQLEVVTWFATCGFQLAGERSLTINIKIAWLSYMYKGFRELDLRQHTCF